MGGCLSKKSNHKRGTTAGSYNRPQQGKATKKTNLLQFRKVVPTNIISNMTLEYGETKTRESATQMRSTTNNFTVEPIGILFK